MHTLTPPPHTHTHQNINLKTDLHEHNVPLALGGVNYAVDKALEEGLSSLVIITGKERVEGGGVRNGVKEMLSRAGCASLYEIDEAKEAERGEWKPGRIYVNGPESLTALSEGLKRLRAPGD